MIKKGAKSFTLLWTFPGMLLNFLQTNYYMDRTKKFAIYCWSECILLCDWQKKEMLFAVGLDSALDDFCWPNSAAAAIAAENGRAEHKSKRRVIN